MTNATIYRKDYLPPSFLIHSIALDFEIYDDHVLVTNRMHLERQHPGPLCLYGDELELLNITLNDVPMAEDSIKWDGDTLILSIIPDECSLVIDSRIRPQDNTKLSGLFASNHLLCTQCEAEGFRRMTFFPDRPDVLTSFTTRIAADKTKYPVLLSNGNLIDEGEEENNRHWVVWHDPFKKPSYLFALVAGSLACVKDTFVTASGKHVDLRIYVEHGNEDKCEHAMASLKNAMRWDEQTYGREYDLDIFMIVAVSDFNMGAMENKGLNIFNAKYILARPDTATDQDYQNIEGVVGHEYFHNWTGNRVTCRDWFQLSLKEGLTVFRDQEFSRDMNSRDVNRIQDVKTLLSAQFPEDAGAMAHPVRPESYQEINNFYTATIYNKGAEVIRMQHTLLGSAGFRRGMDLYFERHDGQAVTIDDFVAAMEDANGVDFTQFKRWYSQAGTPEVRVTSAFDAGTLTLTFAQSCRPTPECAKKAPYHIPIRMALYQSNGEPIPLENEVLALRESTDTFRFSGLDEKPVVSLLREFSAPIVLHQERSREELLFLLRHERDGYAKWDAAQTLAKDVILGFYQAKEATWEVPDALLSAFQHVVTDESLDSALRAELILPPGFEALALAQAETDVTLLETAREMYRAELGAALFEAAEARYQHLWQAETHALDPESFSKRRLRNACLWLMMKGNETEALSLCEQQFYAAKTMTDQVASLSLLANATNPDIRRHALAAFYAQWERDALVLDKWFAIHAQSEVPDVLTEVRTLLNHPAFSIKNPNKVRSLIGGFTEGNPRYFHAADGSGYAFLAEMLLTLDPINSQVAARLATPLTRWRQWDAARQTLIQSELQRLASHPLSRDLSEVVSKSLAP